METLSDVQRDTSNRSWAWYLGLAILGLVLAELLAYVFVWTYVAGDSEWRNGIAQFTAICVLGSLAFVFCVAWCPPPERRFNTAFWVRAWRRLSCILIGAVLLANSPQVLAFHVVDWSSIAWRGLVVAPLSVLFIVGCWMLFVARSHANQELRFAAVFGGIGIGYALLGEFGSIWPLLAMNTVTWGNIWWISRRQSEQAAGGAVSWFGATVAALVLVHVFFTEWPFGWVVALLLTLGIPCIVIARMIIEPSEAPILAPGDEGIVPIRPRRKSWLGRVTSPDELLVLGWIVVVFWSCCWTQPERLDIDPPPTTFSMPEPAAPSPDLAFSGVSLSEAAAHYSAEWDRYNAMQFENDLRHSTYHEMKRISDSWDAAVGTEVKARQVIKTMGGFAIIGFTWFRSRRAGRATKTVPDEGVGDSGVSSMERA